MEDGPISSSQDGESLHLENEQSRGAEAREDSPLTHEEGNSVSLSLDKEGEPSWPSLPALGGDTHAAERRSTTITSKTMGQNQKISSRHGQERTTVMPDSCQAQPASANGCTATGETGNPTESEDNTESYGLMESLHRRNDALQCNLQFLVEEWRCKSQECTELRTEKDHLERQLEASHAECVNQRQQIDQLTRENNLILTESNEMARQLLELRARDLEELNRQRERLDACSCNARSRPPPFLDPDDD